MIRRPDGSVTREMFRSLKDTRDEIQERHRQGKGRRVDFEYSELGFSIDPDSVRRTESDEVASPGTTVELHQVHGDYRVEPLPRYRVVLNRRGGTTATRLKEGGTEA